jgi:hypothetical protein
MALLKDATVFSGATPENPRWPTTSTRNFPTQEEIVKFPDFFTPQPISLPFHSPKKMKRIATRNRPGKVKLPAPAYPAIGGTEHGPVKGLFLIRMEEIIKNLG